MKEKIFPKLFALSSDGRQKEWSISVHEVLEGGICYIKRTHGFTDCKMQRTNKPVESGKNLGKANETTIFEQAVSDAQSLWNKKQDSAYKESEPTKEQVNLKPLPMLALNFTKRKHNIKYPAYVQPKLNGVRCLAVKVDDNTIEYISRKGKVWDTLGHLTSHIIDRMKVGDILDGEIYIHGETFQQIIRLVKKLRPESKTLCYHVYDKADPTLPFDERWNWLTTNFAEISGNGPIRLVNTIPISEEAEVYKYHTEFVRNGYEGVIVRNSDGKYKFTHRSKDLQKYKEFKDEEFVIVGGKAATGTHRGCVVFECKASNDKGTFWVTPKADLARRRKMFKNLDKYIGKEYTVRYQELSEDGIPIGNTVGIAVRDYE